MRLWGNLETFQPYTSKHVIVVFVLVVTIGGLCALARRVPTDRRKRLEPLVGVLLLLVWAGGMAWDWVHPNASARTALPLHWCDLTGILAGAILLQPRSDTRTALHLWGGCFSSIAFIMPIETRGPAYMGFWVYFVTHGVILFSLAYDVIVRQFRAKRQDCLRISLLTGLWVMAVTPFNMLLGANYAYVGDVANGQRTLVQAFGEWPMRIVPMYVVSLTLMAGFVFLLRALRKAARNARERAVGPTRREAPVAVAG